MRWNGMWYTCGTFPGICGTRFFVYHITRNFNVSFLKYFTYGRNTTDQDCYRPLQEGIGRQPRHREIEVSYNRERVRLSTGVAVLKQQWSGKEVVNHPQADHLNEQIRRVYDGIHNKMSSIASTKGEYDLSLLKKVKKTKLQGSSESFLDWLEERSDMRPVTESTRKQHKVMLNCLRDFGASSATSPQRTSCYGTISYASV